MHVFTYGTLMFPEVWQAVVSKEFEVVEGRAAGFEVYRVYGAIFPGMVAEENGEAARGIVYLSVDAESVERLDEFEGDLYERLPIQIDCSDGQRRRADAYVVPEKNRKVLTTELWRGESFLASGGLERFIGSYAGFGRVKDKESMRPQ